MRTMNAATAVAVRSGGIAGSVCLREWSCGVSVVGGYAASCVVASHRRFVVVVVSVVDRRRSTTQWRSWPGRADPAAAR